MAKTTQKKETGQLGFSEFGLLTVQETVSDQYVSPRLEYEKGIAFEEQKLVEDYILRSGEFRTILCSRVIKAFDDNGQEFSFGIGVLPAKGLSDLLPAGLIEIHCKPTPYMAKKAEPLLFADLATILKKLRVLARCSCAGRKT